MKSKRTSLLRSAVAFYIARSPITKGKGRLLYTLRPWLRRENAVTTTRTCFDCVMELDLSEYVQEQIYFFGAYELPLVNYFRSILKPGMVFADIGAQVGQFTLLAAKNVGTSGHVHSFEPTPQSFSRLSRNVSLNGFQNVTCHNIALSDFKGQAELFAQKQDPTAQNTGMNSLRKKSDWKEAVGMTVKVSTLDQELQDLPRLDAIKIDVEGAELSVLRGSRALLEKFRPVIAVEAEEPSARSFGYSTRDLKSYVAGLGYEIFQIARTGKASDLKTTSLIEPELHAMLIAVPNAN